MSGDRLWSGEGCWDDPRYRFVKYGASGVPMFERVDDVGKVPVAKEATADRVDPVLCRIEALTPEEAARHLEAFLEEKRARFRIGGARRRRRRAGFSHLATQDPEDTDEALRELERKSRAPTRKGEEDPMGSTYGAHRSVAAVDRAIESLAKAEHPDVDAATAVAKFLATEEGATLYELRDVLGSVGKADVSLAKVAADAMLESFAREIRKRDPHLTPEAAYVRAMNEHPDVADVAINGS